jgi:hypothetical protein
VGVSTFSIIAITLLSIATALIATRSVLKQKPLELAQGGIDSKSNQSYLRLSLTNYQLQRLNVA